MKFYKNEITGMLEINPVLRVFGKPSMRRGDALAWFHDVWTLWYKSS
jgi:hypothetical protein